MLPGLLQLGTLLGMPNVGGVKRGLLAAPCWLGAAERRILTQNALLLWFDGQCYVTRELREKAQAMHYSSRLQSIEEWGTSFPAPPSCK